jgi:predicted ATPase
MITHFHIENFKSLVDFDLPPKGQDLKKFACLIGLNGAGKSTLLQAFDFISQLVTGDVSGWLERREWKKSELLSHQGARKPTIAFCIDMQTSSGKAIKWTARFNTNHLRCTFEEITCGEKKLLKLEDGALFIAGAENGLDQRLDSIPFEYEGSVLSSLKLNGADESLSEIKCSLQNLRSLELLSPQLMRKKARASKDIGASGEKLSPFLDQLAPEKKVELLKKLREFYPHLSEWNVKGYKAGWKSLRILEDYASSFHVEAGHINDGFLRVIAILSQAYTQHQVLLLDEIENGINPALVEKLMDFLVGLKDKQVIVTTHSPVILNFLDDAVAKDGVLLLYRTTGGETKSCRYFDQPETAQKLEVLGPGEVFVDTDLTRMVGRLAKGVPASGEADGGRE